MITIKNIRNVKYEEYDEVWAIVQSMKNPSPKIKQVKALAPTKSLFFAYRNMANSGTWNQKAFDEIYVPQFLHDLITNKAETYKMLNQLYNLDKAEKKICLVCFCSNETMCHRSIIAGLLQGVGCNVITETGNDYKKYYDRYVKMRETVKA